MIKKITTLWNNQYTVTGLRVGEKVHVHGKPATVLREKGDKGWEVKFDDVTKKKSVVKLEAKKYPNCEVKTVVSYNLGKWEFIVRSWEEPSTYRYLSVGDKVGFVVESQMLRKGDKVEYKRLSPDGEKKINITGVLKKIRRI